MKYTFFTLDVLNNYYHLPFVKLCIDSWYRCADKLKELNIDVEIKLYNNDSVEYREYLKSINQIDIYQLKPSRIANGFRLYILSKYENYCWLDCDTFIYDPESFINELASKDHIFKNSFWLLYSGNNNEIFKFLIDKILIDNEILKLEDKKICEKFEKELENENYKDLKINGIIHLFWLQNYVEVYQSKLQVISKQEQELQIIEELNNDLSLQNIRKFRRKKICICNNKYIRSNQNLEIHEIPEDKFLLDYLLDNFNVQLY